MPFAKLFSDATAPNLLAGDRGDRGDRTELLRCNPRGVPRALPPPALIGEAAVLATNPCCLPGGDTMAAAIAREESSLPKVLSNPPSASSGGSESLLDGEDIVSRNPSATQARVGEKSIGKRAAARAGRRVGGWRAEVRRYNRKPAWIVATTGPPSSSACRHALPSPSPPPAPGPLGGGCCPFGATAPYPRLTVVPGRGRHPPAPMPTPNTSSSHGGVSTMPWAVACPISSMRRQLPLVTALATSSMACGVDSSMHGITTSGVACATDFSPSGAAPRPCPAPPPLSRLFRAFPPNDSW